MTLQDNLYFRTQIWKRVSDCFMKELYAAVKDIGDTRYYITSGITSENIKTCSLAKLKEYDFER